MFCTITGKRTILVLWRSFNFTKNLKNIFLKQQQVRELLWFYGGHPTSPIESKEYFLETSTGKRVFWFYGVHPTPRLESRFLNQQQVQKQFWFYGGYPAPS
jgi:hypothetical protein